MQRWDVAADHPDMVGRLTQEIASFDATLAPAPPDRVAVAPADASAWRHLGRGVATAAAVVLGAVALAIYGLLRALRVVRGREARRR